MPPVALSTLPAFFVGDVMDDDKICADTGTMRTKLLASNVLTGHAQNNAKEQFATNSP